MKVNWDDEIPNIWENKIDVPNHQPVIAFDQIWKYMNLDLGYPQCWSLIFSSLLAFTRKLRGLEDV